MIYKLTFPESYQKKLIKFLKKHPELVGKYKKTIQLLELNPSHPSLRLHKLQGSLADYYSVSINMSYRIVVELLITNKEIIFINIGDHSRVY